MSFVELVNPGMFISDLQRGAAISFCAWIVLGLLVGLIGSKLVNKTGHGLVRDVLLSIFGAIVAGFLSNLLGESHTAGLDFYSLLVATVGAVVFLIAYHAMFRRRRSPVSGNHARWNDSIGTERRKERPDLTSHNSHIHKSG